MPNTQSRTRTYSHIDFFTHTLESGTLATAALWISKMSLEPPRVSATPGNLMPADSTIMPAKPSMATRPCLISASRRKFMLQMSQLPMPRETKFSKVSALVHLLERVTVENTLEKCCLPMPRGSKPMSPFSHILKSQCPSMLYKVTIQRIFGDFVPGWCRSCSLGA